MESNTSNIIKMTMLILVVVFNATIGIDNLSVWAYVLIESISVLLLVYVSIKMISDNKTALEQDIKRLNEACSNFSTEIKAQLDSNTTKLSDSLSSNYELVFQRISDSEEKLVKDIKNGTDHIQEELRLINDFVKIGFSKQNEIVGSLTRNTTERFNGLSKDISNWNECTRKQIVDNTNEVKKSLDTNIEHVSLVLKDAFKTLQETTFTSSEQIQKHIEHICVSIQKSINATTSEITAKTETLGETLKSTSDDIKSKMKSSADSMSRLVSGGVEAITTSISINTDNVRQASTESTEQILLANKENCVSILQKIDGLMQQGISIQDSINSGTSDIVAKTDLLGKIVKSTSDDIKSRVKSSADSMSQLISEGIETITTSVSTNVDNARLASTESAEQILLANKENSVMILQKIDALMQQGTSIQESILTTSTDISENTSSVIESIKTTSDDIINKIEDTGSKTAQAVNNNIEVLIDSISGIDKQTITISSLIVDGKKDSNKATEIIQGQCQVINKGLTSVLLKAQNIENAIQRISENDSNKKIVASIQSVIQELRLEIKNSISEINNEFLDAQITQEATNRELEKLQVLLRTVLKSFEDKTDKLTQEIQEETLKSTNTSSSTQGRPFTSTPSVGQGVISQQENLNRTETIFDSQTKNIVVNQYKDGNIVKSTMKNSKGHIIYEVEYSKGRITKTRNYDEKGKLNIEQTFYANGQVRYRNEFTSKGKTTTEFDINGKKK